MTRFTCKTQTDRIQVFNAPSGRKYTSYVNQPFSVDDKRDAEFFEAKPTRFEKWGMFDKPARQKDVDEELADIVAGIPGVSRTTAAKVAKIYNRLDALIDVCRETADVPCALDESIPEAQANKIIAWVRENHVDPKPEVD